MKTESEDIIFVTVHRKGNGSNKMEGMVSINTSALNNPFCESMQKGNGICKHCYSRKQERAYPAVRRCYARNGEIMSSRVIPFDELPRINAAFVRFSAFGELINDNHLINLKNICIVNPFVRFTLWTKRKDIVEKYRKLGALPTNLKLIYSNPRLDHIIETPEGWDGVFNVVTTEKEQINCVGKCMNCLRCYAGEEIGCIVERIK